jgi:uncharacterized protein YjbI with pentapeptide repeats
MANPEHLKILQRGLEVWNKWINELRERHFALHGEIPDLTGANLRGARLSGASFICTDFKGAFLGGADLTDSYLYEADFRSADLKHADLRGADFRAADLRGADLTSAELDHADLRGAKLRGADFTDVGMGDTILWDNDLSEVKGLEMVRHYVPSVISIDTIYKSQGNIPEGFLRGCGVPEDFITYMRSLVAHPIQFYSCFISYSSKDQDFADRLHADLQNKGVRCWFAPEDLKIGDRIRDRIDESIRLRDKLLLILSEHSIESGWVEHEVESALEEERQSGRTILFPIRVDDAVMGNSKAWAALVRRTCHIGDFTRWKGHDSYQKAFDRLLRDLKAEEKKA